MSIGAGGTSSRIAVLIDADNTSPSHVEGLFEEVAKYGVAMVRRAYGDWTTPQLTGWKKSLNEHAISPVQQFAYTTGKNSTDFALVIDAMDLLFTGHVDAFAIVSSDSDFTRLVTRLRESGKTVYGLGLRKTPVSLQRACDRFIFLEVLRRDAVDVAGDAARTADDSDADVPDLPALQPLVRSAIDSVSGDDGWASLSAIGNYLRTSLSSFDSRNYGYSRLSLLLEAQPYVEWKGNGNSRVVRVKTQPAKKSAARKGAAAKKSAAKTAAPKAGATKKAAAKRASA